MQDAFRAGGGLERRAAAEHRPAFLEVARIADIGLQEVGLVQRVLGGAADLEVVERRLLPVEAQHVGAAEMVGDADLDVLVLLQHRQEVVRHQLNHVDLAREQRIDRGLAVGDGDPFDSVELGDLAAGQARRRLAARLVVGIADVDDPLARLPFVPLEDERARAGGVGDLLADRQLGDPLGHDEQRHRRRLGERLQHQAEGLLEHDAEGAVVDRVHRLRHPGEQAALHVLVGEALDRGQDISRSDRRSVVPLEPVAQLEGPGELVVAHRPALDHLRLRLELGVEREQLVVDQVAVVAHDVGGGPHRIDNLEIRMHHDLDRLGLLRERGPRQQKGRKSEERTTQHGQTPYKFIVAASGGRQPVAVKPVEVLSMMSDRIPPVWCDAPQRAAEFAAFFAAIVEAECSPVFVRSVLARA